MTIIHIGDGRHVELDEGAAFRPPPPPPPRKRRRSDFKPPLTLPTKRRKTNIRPHFKFGDEHQLRKRMETQVGYKEWWAWKNEIIAKYANRGRRLGEGPGRGRQRFGYMKGQAKIKIKRDMENIDKKYPDIDPMAREALEGAVSVLREPNSQTTKLAAARLILEFTKSKPVAKSEVSVNAAEAWLASLGKED